LRERWRHASRNMPLPTSVTVPNLVALGQMLRVYTYGDPPEKLSRASCLSVSLKVIGSIGYLDSLLMVYNSHGPISYRFRKAISVEKRKLSPYA